jgi:hypothetical protein
VALVGHPRGDILLNTEEKVTRPPVPPNLCVGYLWVAFAVMASIWSTLASYLSAHQFIAVGTEIYSYWIAVPLTILCGAKYVSNRSGDKRWHCLVVRGTIFVSILLLALVAWARSADTFCFWKLKDISPDSWPQIIAGLQKAGRTSADNGGRSFGATAFPESLSPLGTKEDFILGRGRWLTRPGYTGLVAYAEFGYRVRIWGLFVGPEKLLDEGWPGVKKVPVGQDSFFIVGVRREYRDDK